MQLNVLNDLAKAKRRWTEKMSVPATVVSIKNSLMEHDRFLHTTKREECNVSLHVCGDFEQH
jgi:hypothetical protein